MDLPINDAIAWAEDGGELGGLAGFAIALARASRRWLTQTSFHWTERELGKIVLLATFWGLVGGLAGFVLYFASNVR